MDLGVRAGEGPTKPNVDHQGKNVPHTSPTWPSWSTGMSGTSCMLNHFMGYSTKTGSPNWKGLDPFPPTNGALGPHMWPDLESGIQPMVSLCISLSSFHSPLSDLKAYA